MWNAANITDGDKKISQFVGTLRKRVVTWYMNFTKNQSRTKDEIKKNFLSFLKTEDVVHLAAQNLKEIK